MWSKIKASVNILGFIAATRQAAEEIPLRLYDIGQVTKELFADDAQADFSRLV